MPSRKRPGMYIGSTGYRGLHHMLWEIIDNSIDEAANGFADTIDIILYPTEAFQWRITAAASPWASIPS